MKLYDATSNTSHFSSHTMAQNNLTGRYNSNWYIFHFLNGTQHGPLKTNNSGFGFTEYSVRLFDLEDHET